MVTHRLCNERGVTTATDIWQLSFRMHFSSGLVVRETVVELLL